MLAPEVLLFPFLFLFYFSLIRRWLLFFLLFLFPIVLIKGLPLLLFFLPLIILWGLIVVPLHYSEYFYKVEQKSSLKGQNKKYLMASPCNTNLKFKNSLIITLHDRNHHGVFPSLRQVRPSIFSSVTESIYSSITMEDYYKNKAASEFLDYDKETLFRKNKLYCGIRNIDNSKSMLI